MCEPPHADCVPMGDANGYNPWPCLPDHHRRARSGASLQASARASRGDERLVEQIRRGNELAFEVAFERHGAGILSFCRHMLGSREEAEDAVQHTFAAAYRDLQRGGERQHRAQAVAVHDRAQSLRVGAARAPRAAAGAPRARDRGARRAGRAARRAAPARSRMCASCPTSSARRSSSPSSAASRTPRSRRCWDARCRA